MAVTSRAAAPAQRSVQALAVRQSTLHEPVHVTSHVAVSLQVTLLLAPTVASQSASTQKTFELFSAVTTQLEPAAHEVLQLAPHA